MPDFTTESLINKRYRVLSILGEGGQGAVYKAADTRDGDLLRAVKIARYDSDDDGNALARITTEYSVLSKLSHPNIVRVFEAGRMDDKTCFLVMEFIEGRSVALRTDRASRLASRKRGMSGTFHRHNSEPASGIDQLST